MLVTTMTTPAINDLVVKSFAVGVMRPASQVRQLFHKKTGDWARNAMRVQEMDRERYGERKVQGQSSAQRGISQGYYKDISQYTISITRKVSGEEYKALEATGLSSMATGTAEDIVDKIELDMLNYIGYGHNASYTDNGGFTVDTTVGDGLSFFNTTHTLKNSATTYSNILSGAPALSEVSIESAEDYYTYNVMDNNGKRLKMKPTHLITTEKARMVNRVARLFGSSAPSAIESTANANSGVLNVNKNRFQHIAIGFDIDSLGDVNTNLSYNWILASLGGTPETSLQAYYISWLSPEVAPVEVNQDKWTLSFTARAVVGIGAVSGKGALISQATS
mgnify:CR=1 FL=1